MHSLCELALRMALAASAAVSSRDGVLQSASSPQSQPQAPVTSGAGMSPLVPAQIDNKLAIVGDDLKARVRDDRLTVGVTVNGRGPYQFVVDSGADTSVIGLAVAHALGLPPGTPTILNATTDRKIVDRVKVSELSVGASTFTNLQLPALREADLGAAGMLGIDALAEQRLMLDFQNRTIRVEDARRKWPHVPGEIVIVARRRRGQLILTEIDVAGERVSAVIDTGSQVTIGNLALRNKLFRRSQQLPVASAVGVTGIRVPVELAPVPEIRVGPALLRNATIAFADVPPFAAFGLTKGPALLLGTDILRAFKRVSLDFRARKVRFELTDSALALPSAKGRP